MERLPAGNFRRSVRTALASLLHVDEDGLDEALADVGHELAAHVGTDPALREFVNRASAEGQAKALRKTARKRPAVRNASPGLRKYLGKR